MKHEHWLSQVAKYHDLWLQIAENLGAKDYAQDIIQEAYIKLDKYNCKDKILKDNKVSKGYMFFVIRSLFLNYVKAKSKIRKVDLDANHTKENLRMPASDYQRICFDLTSEDTLEEERAFGKLCDKMDKELESLHWYDRRIFEIYRDTPLSIRGMSKETQISFVNIFHTLKKVKQVMRDKFQEDYEDYLFGDYERI
tara:strand:+ start:1915 stop:2502 length:588 start_codon:yes stop_codon:yes gene_type:complete